MERKIVYNKIMQGTRELSFCQELFPELVELVMRDFEREGTKKELKDDNTAVTETDLKADRLLREKIQEVFPGDRIVSEEDQGDRASRSSRGNQGRVWVIDPICGTGNFAIGILSFTTNIALFEGGECVFAFVVDYPKRTYYWTSEGNEGVYEEDTRVGAELVLDTPWVLNVDGGDLNNKGSDEQLKAYTQILVDLIKSKYFLVCPASSLSFTYMSLAKYGALVIPLTNIWDVAPACYFTEKNGGVATDFAGKRWSLESRDIVASVDKRIHKKMLEIVQKYWK